MRKHSYRWWNVAGIVVFVAGFLVGSINMASRGGSMTGGETAMMIAAVLQALGGGVAVVAFALDPEQKRARNPA